jgi:hypothetical protein
MCLGFWEGWRWGRRCIGQDESLRKFVWGQVRIDRSVEEIRLGFRRDFDTVLTGFGLDLDEISRPVGSGDEVGPWG